MSEPYTEADARERDAEDPLSEYRERFYLPADCYMDGNSLGPLSRDAERTLQRVLDEWRELGIEGWTEADVPWFEYGERLGAKTAPLVGAAPEEVVVANSTTVNIHALVSTFLPTDGKVIVNELDFPTDHYAIRGQLRQRGLDPDDHLVVVESRDGRTIEEDDVIDAMDAHGDAGVLFMPSVLYRSGQLLDVERLAGAARERGLLAGFDLAHSIGAVPHRLSEWDVDFAVWCGYKYLNAGPGAIAGLYVDERHFGTTPGLPGWWGHQKETQFELRQTYTPAESAGAWQIGTVPVLAAAPLEGSLDVLGDAGIEAVREKSVALTDYLVDLIDERCADDYAVGTPRDPDRRGGHVAVEHPEAGRISRVLRDRGVVVDYRPPNVIRICPAALYARYVDVWRVVEHLREVAETGAYADVSEPDGVT